MLAMVSFAGHAQEPSDADDWLERSRAILEQSASVPVPDWLRTTPTEAAIAQAEAIVRASGMRPDLPARMPPRSGTVYIFGSLSIPPATLRNLLAQAAEDDVVFVLRGLVPGTNLNGTLAALERALGPLEDVPDVIIDPTLFRRFNIASAPTLVLMRDDPDPPVMVVGAVTVSWLRERAETLGRSDETHLGARGEFYTIAEVDLIEEMQRRLATIDWNQRREAAIDRYWRDKSDYIELPDASADREFEVDPSIRVTEDIRDPEGNLLIYAGERFNPLELVPLSKTIIVFRGTDPRQVEKAGQLARAVREDGRGVILLTTTVDPSLGWGGLNTMETDLQGPVYLLQQNLAERFQLAHVPSTVEARGTRLLVREYGLGSNE